MSPINLLQVIFIVLKVLNLIEWSWLKVFIPLIVKIVIYIVAAIIKSTE